MSLTDRYTQAFRAQQIDQSEQYCLNVGSRVAPHELVDMHAMPLKKAGCRHDFSLLLRRCESRPRFLQRRYPAFPAALGPDIGSHAIVEVRNDVDKGFWKYLQAAGANNLALFLVSGLLGGCHERSSCGLVVLRAPGMSPAGQASGLVS